MKINDTNSNLTSHLIILSGLFFLLQLVLVLGNISSYLLVNNVHDNPVILELFSSRLMILPLLQLLFSQLLIYGLFAFAINILARTLGERFNVNKLAVYYLGIFLWLIATAGVIVANDIFFPHSFFNFDNLLSTAPNLKILLFMLVPLIIIITTALSFALVHAALKIFQNEFWLNHVVIMGVGVAVLWTVAMNYFPRSAQQWQATNSATPNIILIGIDGVRPDFVNNDLTAPNINAFLKSSVNFTNAYTPIAQTFPAWISILTSLGPKANGARENLPWLADLNINQTLPKQLKTAGYETIFATDDSRFITIKKNVGFNRLITPKQGVAEFVIGAFNDFPLTNLFITTALGKRLFPYNYANHESQVTYLPQNFLEIINETLNHPTNKPLFLAVHFNVSGWPFGWARSQLDSTGPWYNRYIDGIHQVDNQFGQFLKLLSQHNLLKNTVIVLLSDHGITLGLPHDRDISEKGYQGNHPNFKQLLKTIYLPQLALKTKGGLDTSYGYGGDLLSLKQNHVVLAFKSYGFPFPPSQRVAMRSSLLDIAPTILDLLKQPPLPKAKGVALMSALSKKTGAAPALYLETSSISTIGVPTESLMNSRLWQDVSYYSFDVPGNIVYFKQAIAQAQLLGKQYAIFSGNWLLAEIPGQEKVGLVPDPGNPKATLLKHIRGPSYMVLLNTATGKWTMELNSAWARTTPVKDLCNKLFTFYGDDFDCLNCCKPYVRSARKSITTPA